MRIVYVARHHSVHTRRWVSFFAARGHEVHVVTPGGADAHDVDEQGLVIARTYRVHDLGEPRFGKLGYLFKLRRARKIIRELDPDVVHAHYATSCGLLALAAGVRPLVTTAHGDDLLISPRNPLMRRLVQRVLRASALITVPSEQMREAARRLLGADHPVHIEVFQYGVEVARLARVAESVREADMMPRDQRPLRIVSTRAMLGLYRLDALIDALAVLAARDIEFHCDFLGDGPDRAALEARAREHRIDGYVTFHGHTPAPRMERLVAAADLYVSVSESDGVSLSLLEALVLGAIPVLSDIPANRSWVNDGQTGVLVAIDAAEIADGMLRAYLLDPDVAARDNRSVVAEHADRDTNLAACELLIDDIAGVSWNPDPITGSKGQNEADAA
ncbi:MAG: glycosyltransferase [Thermoleophilia bacterium]|nr:glycosyltransferase [Thermoleophilia bacterium]